MATFDGPMLPRCGLQACPHCGKGIGFPHNTADLAQIQMWPTHIEQGCRSLYCTCTGVLLRSNALRRVVLSVYLQSRRGVTAVWVRERTRLCKPITAVSRSIRLHADAVFYLPSILAEFVQPCAVLKADIGK